MHAKSRAPGTERLKPRERGNQERDLQARSKGFGAHNEFGVRFGASAGFGGDRAGGRAPGDFDAASSGSTGYPGGGGGNRAKKSEQLRDAMASARKMGLQQCNGGRRRLFLRLSTRCRLASGWSSAVHLWALRRRWAPRDAAKSRFSYAV